MKTIILGLLLGISLLITNTNQPTIILINGVPHLVILGKDGFIVETIQTVPYYFTSSQTHEEIVAGLVRQLDQASEPFFTENEQREIPVEEVDILENAEFIRFIPGKALLDRIAVDRIREIANDFVDGGISTIRLEITYRNTSVSKLLTDNRLDSVKDLLVAFGVTENAIEIEKNLRNDLDINPFVRVQYKKSLR